MKTLKKWDGKSGGYTYKYLDEIEKWNMQVDDNGTIWYINGNGELSVWCPANRLTGHLRYLEQIAAR